MKTLTAQQKATNLLKENPDIEKQIKDCEREIKAFAFYPHANYHQIIFAMKVLKELCMLKGYDPTFDRFIKK